jgi:hypothetical protein
MQRQKQIPPLARRRKSGCGFPRDDSFYGPLWGNVNDRAPSGDFHLAEK